MLIEEDDVCCNTCKDSICKNLKSTAVCHPVEPKTLSNIKRLKLKKYEINFIINHESKLVYDLLKLQNIFCILKEVFVLHFNMHDSKKGVHYFKRRTLLDVSSLSGGTNS